MDAFQPSNVISFALSLFSLLSQNTIIANNALFPPSPSSLHQSSFFPALPCDIKTE